MKTYSSKLCVTFQTTLLYYKFEYSNLFQYKVISYTFCCRKHHMASPWCACFSEHCSSLGSLLDTIRVSWILALRLYSNWSDSQMAKWSAGASVSSMGFWGMGMIYVPHGTEQDRELFCHTKEWHTTSGLENWLLLDFDIQIFWPAVKPQIRGEYCLSGWVKCKFCGLFSTKVITDF